MAMKYVIYKKKVQPYGGMPAETKEQCVLFSGATAHREAVPRGITKGDLISAGFFHIEHNRVVIHYDGSESLNLSPRRNGDADEKLILSELISPNVMEGHNVTY